MEKYGIENVKEVISFVVALVKAIKSILEDGKINISDVIRLFGAFLKAPKAIVGFKFVFEEIKDLSEAERVELLTFITQDLGLTFASADKWLSHLVTTGLKLHHMAADIELK
jgi:hypothetical protein